MKIPPWSFTHYDTFVTCPRMFYEKYVAKSIPFTPGPEAQYGTWVHKQFELRVLHGTPLPEAIASHEDYIQKITAPGGKILAERKVGITRALQPCSFFDKAVWHRGVADFTRWNGQHVKLVDYKTGKKRPKGDQLKLGALIAFAEGAELVDTEFYWTQEPAAPTRAVYSKDQVPELWAGFVPNLRQYAQAFSENIWQPRQNGLCNGWCEVKDCEFWRPRRPK